jgi:hypothetical protein
VLAPAPLGTAPLGTVPLGTVPLGTVPLGTAPLGTATLTAGGGTGRRARPVDPCRLEIYEIRPARH